mmetsp:Transcript_3019/g.4690  ORF Transcript_3019/g.4690 Transcript_3019/m.4690 type:complete len:533 (+) Transcript_3019:188-1786(+)
MTSLVQNPPAALLSTAANYLTNAVAITTSIQSALLEQSLSQHYSSVSSSSSSQTNKDSRQGWFAVSDVLAATSSTSSSSSLAEEPMVQSSRQTSQSLNGYAFSCDNGLFLAFSNDHEIYCRSRDSYYSSTNRKCGTYHLEQKHNQKGQLVLRYHQEKEPEQEFHSQELEWIDNLLLNFVYTTSPPEQEQEMEDICKDQHHQQQQPQEKDRCSQDNHKDFAHERHVDEEQVSCHAVSLNWKQYSFHDLQYVGLQCPLQQQQQTQNIVEVGLYEEHHFSFGMSGDVALRSPLQVRTDYQDDTFMMTTTTLAVRDWYGIFRLIPSKTAHSPPTTKNENPQYQMMKIYLGAQQGRPTTVLEAQVKTTTVPPTSSNKYQQDNDKDYDELEDAEQDVVAAAMKNNEEKSNANVNNVDDIQQQEQEEKEEQSSNTIPTSEMYLFGYYPSGPCHHDGTSALQNFNHEGFVTLMNTFRHPENEASSPTPSNQGKGENSDLKQPRTFTKTPWHFGVHQMVHHHIQQAQSHMRGIPQLINNVI